MEMVRVVPIKRSTLDVKEVAEYLGISTDMVYILCREKRIAHFRIGSRILFKKEAIDNWIEKQMIEGIEHDYRRRYDSIYTFARQPKFKRSYCI